MKKVIVVFLCLALAFSFVACGSDSSSDTSYDTASEEAVETEDDMEEEESEPAYDYSWPWDHREMLRHPEEFEGKIIQVEGIIVGDAEYEEGTRGLVVKNEEDSQELAIILYDGELNEKPLEGDRVTATGEWNSLHNVNNSDYPMINSSSVWITPEN